MSIRKRRAAIWLSMVIALMSVFEVLPYTTVKAEAATKVLGESEWYVDGGFSTVDWQKNVYGVEAEKGQKVDLGKYIFKVLYSKEWGWREYACDCGGSFKSSNTSTASVTKKGIVDLKKTGNVTITYKGTNKKTIGIQMIVVAAGKNTKAAKGSKMIQYAAELKKAYGTKLTAANRYKVYNYKNLMERNDSTGNVTSFGFLKEKGNYGYYETNKLVDPNGAYREYTRVKLEEYRTKTDPIGTTSAKWFKITSAAGKGSNVDLTISQAVTADQIFGAQLETHWDTMLTKEKQTGFACIVVDTTTHRSYVCQGDLVQGSKKIKISLQNATLIKGRKYSLWENHYETGWLKGKTFVAK